MRTIGRPKAPLVLTADERDELVRLTQRARVNRNLSAHAQSRLAGRQRHMLSLTESRPSVPCLLVDPDHSASDDDEMIPGPVRRDGVPGPACRGVAGGLVGPMRFVPDASDATDRHAWRLVGLDAVWSLHVAPPSVDVQTSPLNAAGSALGVSKKPLTTAARLVPVESDATDVHC